MYRTNHDPASWTPEEQQTTALPEFTKWLFESFYNKFTSVEDKAIAKEFISQFMRKYLNYEIGSLDMRVWRSKLYFGLEKNRHLLIAASDEYKDLINASTNLSRTEKHNRTYEDMRDRTGTHTDDRTSNLEADQTASGGSSSNSTQSGTSQTRTTGGSIGSQTSSGTTEDNRSEKTDGDVMVTGTTTTQARGINSDYPQTEVNLTIDLPESESWSYASQGSDSKQKVSSNQDTVTNNTVTGNSSGKTSSKVDTTDNTTSQADATSSGDASGSSEFSNTSRNTSSGTSKSVLSISDHDMDTGNSSDDIVIDYDTISQFDRIRELLKYLEANPYSPIYTVIDNLVTYFMATYPDEWRDGYIEPDTDLTGGLI